MDGLPKLKLNGVDVVRGGRVLISDLSLTLDRPQVLWVEGGNGIGKTSLLRTCAGLSRPDAGKISWFVDAAPVAAPECVAFLPASGYAKPGLSAQEEAALWGADLNTVGLSAHAETRTEKLSTGQIKRLSLANLIAAKKPIWILDEPLAGLDAAGRVEIAQYLTRHVEAGRMALIASHAPIPIKNIFTQRLTLG